MTKEIIKKKKTRMKLLQKTFQLKILFSSAQMNLKKAYLLTILMKEKPIKFKET